MSAEDTITPEWYAPWPNLGKKLSEQLGEIRNDTAAMAPVSRGAGLDASGDFSNLDGIAKSAVQAWEIGKQGFGNKFRTHYNKADDLFEIAYNTGTTLVPNWYTTWWVDKDGHVTQQNTPTTVSNIGSGQGWFKQKVGVDLEFKSITATSPITIVNDGDTIDVDGSDLISNYSSLGGDESLITSKSNNNLPFKGLSAGPNVVLTASGTSIQIESTAQVVEFYGIVVQHTDGSAIFPGVHILKVDPAAFYLVAPASGRSAETILGFRGETLVSSSFVAVIGDEMTGPLLQADGSLSDPSFAFTDDPNTGIRRRAADDMAFVSGGADIARVLTDRFLVSKRLQVTAAGNAGTPDIFWNDDSTTGLFQNTPSDDSIAFSTAGVRAGYFDASQDLFVTNEIKAGDGAVGGPAFSFSASGQTDVGMYRKTTDQLAFATGGVLAGYFNASQNLILSQHAFAPAGTVGAPAFAVGSNTTTGIYEHTTGPSLGFAVEGSAAARLTTGGVLILDSVSVADGTKTIPTLRFTNETDTGLYSKGTAILGISVNDTDVADFSQTYLNMDVPIRLLGGSDAAPSLTGPDTITGVEDTGIWFANASTIQFTVSGNRMFTMAAEDVSFRRQLRSTEANVLGTASAPDYSFWPDVDTGIFHDTANQLGFTTGGTRAGYFDENQNLHVLNDVISSRVEAGIGVFYTSLNVDGDLTMDSGQVLAQGGAVGAPGFSFKEKTNTGIYFSGVTLRFSSNGIAVGTMDTTNWRAFRQFRIVDSGGPNDLNLTWATDTNTGFWHDFASGVELSAPLNGNFQAPDNFHAVTGGTVATTWDENQDFWVHNDIYVTKSVLASRVEAGIGVFYTQLNTDRIVLDRNGSLSEPALAFAGNPDTGLFLNSTNDFQIIQNGVSFLRFTSGRYIPKGPLQVESVGTKSFPAYSWISDVNTGIYQNSSGDNSIAFSTDDTRAGYFDSDQNLHVTGDIIAGGDLFQFDKPVSAKVVTGGGEFYRTLLISDGGTENGPGEPSLAFINDTDTGLFRVGPNTLGFTTGGVQAGYFSSHQDFYVAKRIFVADEAYSSAGWNNDLSVPTKNAVRDKIVELKSDRFYLTAKQSDDAASFGGLNVFAFNTNTFYLTQNSTNTDEVMINLRGFVDEGSSPTWTGRHTFTSSISQIQGTRNLIIGENAGTDGIGDDNIFLGYNAGNANESTGDKNTFIGSGAGKFNTTGDSNVFIGYQAGLNSTTGDDNVVIGSFAGDAMTISANNNVFIGDRAGSETTTGDSNVYIGQRAGELNSTGFRNTLVGNRAGGGVVSTFGTCSFFGYQSGLINEGSDNTFFGYITGKENTTGDKNTFIGTAAGELNITGSNNVYIGYNTGNLETTASDQLWIDNTNTSTPLIKGDFSSKILTINDNLVVVNDVKSSRVEAGLAVFYIQAQVADDAYDTSGWDGNLSVPTKNAIRDKIESLGGGSGDQLFYLTVKHSDDTTSFGGLNLLAFNVGNFYLTQNPPNTDEVMINLRGQIEESSSPTWTGRHTFGEGTSTDSTIAFNKEFYLQWSVGYDYSEGEFVITSGEMDGTNNEIALKPDQIGFFNTAPTSQPAAYTRNNTIVEDRTLLASPSATTLNNNNVLAALIADLQALGLIG